MHFAVSQAEVYTSTKLAGDDTFFLPFNLGTPGGGVGNPTTPGKYDTRDLWEEVFASENRLELLGRFVHLGTRSQTLHHPSAAKNEPRHLHRAARDKGEGRHVKSRQRP